VITALIFIGTYAVVAAGRAPFLRIDRTGAAIVGAILMVVTGAIPFDDAVRAVDMRTLVLLFSMMIIVAHLRLAGGLAAFARFVSGHISRSWVLIVALSLVAGVLSALFVNDTICLVFTPVVLDLAAARREPPLPYLLTLATASNIGSAATITGNPQNILIGSLSRVSFGRFAAAIGPVSVLGLLVASVLVWYLYGRTSQPAAAAGAAPTTHRHAIHKALLWKTLVVTILVVIGFLAGFDTALVAAAGAAVLLVTRQVKPRKVYTAIDWDLLMLFVGLFVVVGAGARAGFDRWMFDILRPLGIATVGGLSATAAILSNVISNVPAVMLLARVVPQLPDPDRAWLVLAMSSTFAGNVTILGSIANLIVVEGARKRGVEIGFWEYAKVGVPLSLITILLGVIWLS
jgi:Na+/H+ antiporter NhaD/arsenite permease-like protein